MHSAAPARQTAEPQCGVATGVVECVGVAIMVGLAVDYIVHMSTAVAHCGLQGRAAVGFALRTVGLSVVSGAVTTIGAAVFLLPCEMAVFQQFGVLPPYACVSPMLPCCWSVSTQTGGHRFPFIRPKPFLLWRQRAAWRSVYVSAAASAQCSARSAAAASKVTTRSLAGTMVVVTLFTALVFALVVFPALCSVAPCGRAMPDMPWQRRLKSFPGGAEEDDAFQLADAPGALASSRSEARDGPWSASVGTPPQSRGATGSVLQCAAQPVHDSRDSTPC